MKNIGRVSITRDGKVQSSLIATESVSQRSETVGNVVDRYNQDSERRTKEAVFPFQNEVCMIKVSGQSLKNALEMSYAHIDDFGGFYQISGMKVLIDKTAAEGNRVKSVKVDVAGNVPHL